jgi:hypothetical protein
MEPAAWNGKPCQQGVKLFFTQFVRRKWPAASINEKQVAFAVMSPEVSAQSRLEFLRHGQIRFARLGLYSAGYPRCSINALPDTDNVPCEVHVRSAECKSLTDAQPEYSGNRNDCAQWL